MSDTKLILDSLRRIVRALRLASRQAERTYGVSAAQLYVMQKLKERDGQSINELAERTLTDQSSVSTVVSRLAAQGLVVRQTAADDARRAELHLSAAGKKLIGKLAGTEQQRLIAALDALGADDRAQLAALLHKLVDKAGLLGDSAPLFFEDQG